MHAAPQQQLVCSSQIVKPLTLRCWSCKGCSAARDVLVDCISGFDIPFALAAGLGHILGLSSSMLKQFCHAGVKTCLSKTCIAQNREPHHSGGWSRFSQARREYIQT